MNEVSKFQTSTYLWIQSTNKFIFTNIKSNLSLEHISLFYKNLNLFARVKVQNNTIVS